MNDDELKKLWQQQPLRDSAPSAAHLISAMQSKTSLFRRCLNARDLRELIACAVVILVFGYFYFTVYREPLSRVGVWIIFGSMIVIAGKLIYTRRMTPPAPPGATVVESLRAELKSVRAQSHLLGSVLWWYILPALIGVTVATWGLKIDPFSKIICTVFFIAVNTWVYRVNQRAVSDQLLPLEAQLQSLLHSAETGEPPDETHAANLRPIILSLAAADRAKPAEFKVAFWQLAVFGIPGIVGIWFFLMLGFTLDIQDGKPKVQAPGMVVQTIPAAEANRYSVVARQIVDWLNAGDYAAVQELFTPAMSGVLPPTKASEFFTNLVTRYGSIEKFDGPTANGYSGWIAFQLHGQRAELTMSLALDTENKISGVHFAPTPQPPRDTKTFILQLFSWQHLVWLPPFFLAGLLYTWLIQKTTERAVGISSLGIHLNKGQTLILWDEIKEVRPLSFLHVKNLWLIRESGEKLLMHWTPLERHSDLKAAVEGFAPANHPMRSYLSLLRRT